MLTQLRIENFHSIKSISMDLGRLGVLSGSNNAGKSNILRAIGVLFGQKWPPNALSEDDKHHDGRSLPIILEARLDPPISREYYGPVFQVHGLRLSYTAPDAWDFVCLDTNGNPVQTRYGKDLPVNNEARNQISAIQVDSIRDLTDELRASQWSVLGKLLMSIRDVLTSDPVYVTEHATRATHLAAHVKAGPVDDLQRLLNEEMQGITGFSTLNLSFDPPDLIDSLKALRISVSEKAGIPGNPAEEMGQGLQSALVVAFVRAYQRLKQTGPILLLEEPESYLHPQGRRSFFEILRRVSASGCQVLCTTHSTEFVDLTQPETLYIVRKDVTRGTSVVRGNPLTLTPSERTELKMATEFSPGLREITFSTCAILSEGSTEESAIPEILRRCGRDCDTRGLAVRAVGGKENLPFFLELTTSLGIPTIAVFDTDSDKADFATYHVPLNDKIRRLAGGPSHCWTSDPNFEVAHRIPTSDTSKARSALRWARGLSDADANAIGVSLVALIDPLIA
jgi:putative ATP-dependent endonuclease of the OLD family